VRARRVAADGCLPGRVVPRSSPPPSGRGPRSLRGAAKLWRPTSRTRMAEPTTPLRRSVTGAASTGTARTSDGDLEVELRPPTEGGHHPGSSRCRLTRRASRRHRRGWRGGRSPTLVTVDRLQGSLMAGGTALRDRRVARRVAAVVEDPRPRRNRRAAHKGLPVLHRHARKHRRPRSPPTPACRLERARRPPAPLLVVAAIASVQSGKRDRQTLLLSTTSVPAGCARGGSGWRDRPASRCSARAPCARARARDLALVGGVFA